MIAVLDTNIFLSSLISPYGAPAKVVDTWKEGHFRVATCPEQLEELRRASRYPKLKDILKPHYVGKMLNTLQRADVYSNLRRSHSAADANDAYLLDLAEVANAHYLVTGDKRSGLLDRRKVGSTRILGVTAFSRIVSKA